MSIVTNDRFLNPRYEVQPPYDPMVTAKLLGRAVGYTPEQIQEVLRGQEAISAQEFLGIDSIPAEVRLSVVLNMENFTPKARRLFACWCARRVLHLYERHNLSELRPRAAIEAAERFARDSCDLAELVAAHRNAVRANDAAMNSDDAPVYSASLSAVYAAYPCTDSIEAAETAASAAGWAVWGVERSTPAQDFELMAHIRCARALLYGVLDASTPVAEWPTFEQEPGT